MSSLTWSQITPDGSFSRRNAVFRNFVSKEPGSQYLPEKGRYHLYVSWACPWAHRTLIVRKLKGLEDIISFDVVDWYMSDRGWRFNTAERQVKGATTDTVNHVEYIRQIYLEKNPDYTARFSVPVLFDKKTKTIVSNESSEIIRMLYTQFDDLVEDKFRRVDLYPEQHQKEIDELNEWIYNDINNGVYKSGLARTQEAYEKSVTQLFKSLDRVESHLEQVAKQQQKEQNDNANANANDGSDQSPKPAYLVGGQLTEADIRLFPTIVRFDVVYVQHFKCNIRDIRHGYPHIHNWLRHLYWDLPAFQETTDFDHIKQHYTKSHLNYNPTGVTPAGPVPHIFPKNV